MARPIKSGLCYFPLNTDFLSDRKIQRLIQKYESRGVVTYVAILCEAYGTNGYFTRYTDDLCFDIGFTVHLDETLVTEIIDFCVQIHLFDRRLLESKRILTSRGMQLRFREISKRSIYSIDPELELSEEKPFSGVSVEDTHPLATDPLVNVTETPVSAAITPLNINGNINSNTSQTKKQFFNGTQSSNNNGDAARRDEILRMATVATKGH